LINRNEKQHKEEESLLISGAIDAETIEFNKKLSIHKVIVHFEQVNDGQVIKDSMSILQSSDLV
jgi:hypothetical protein